LLAGDAIGADTASIQATVSIRARHCWRAMRHPEAQHMGNAVFQSAPAIAGGRCKALTRAAFGARGFNPRPPLLAGDAHGHGHIVAVQIVSIRARHCWRAMLGALAMNGVTRSFQSAPAIAGGRCTWTAGGGYARTDVSIRARHCWRAMLITLDDSLAFRQFQSAPAIAGGRCPAMESWARDLGKFQSAPAIAGGRCASLPTPCQSCTFSCSRANVCSTIRLVKQTYASKEEKHRTTTTYEACEPVRRNAITPGSRRAR